MCETPKQATWMCAALALENIEVWSEDTLVFIPCSPDFDVFTDVKNAIAAVGKVNGAWEQHLLKTGGYDPLLNWNLHFH
jgi:hypothetical protein